MTIVLHDLLRYFGLLALVTGIVIAAASLVI